MDKYNTLRISRAQEIEESYDVAVIKLNEFSHIIGQPVMVRYRNLENKINTLVALGIGNGPGKDNYKIVSNGEVVPVNKIYLDRLEDVSQLIHGETTICNFEGVFYYCIYQDGTLKRINPITRDTVFYNGADGFHWYYNVITNTLKRADDFLPAEEVRTKLNTIMSIITSISGSETPDPEDEGGSEGDVPDEEKETVTTGNSLVKCSLSVSPTSFLYTGEAISVAVSYSFSFGNKPIVPNSLSLMLNGEPFYSVADSSGQTLVAVSDRGKSVISLRATVSVSSGVDAQTIYQEIPVTAYPPVKYTQSSFESKKSIDSIGSWETTKMFEFPGNLEIVGTLPGYLWIAIPFELTESFEERFLMSSVQFPVVKVEVDELGGYTYYRTEKQQVPGTYKIRIE